MVKFLAPSLLALTLMIMNPVDATSSSTAPVTCSARVSAGDYAVGIDLITDTTCQSGGLGCLGSVCRFCKHQRTPESAHLLDCPSTATTTPTISPTTTPSSTSSECAAMLSVGDRAVGILTAQDTSCVTGGVGCISSTCRYCRAQTTPQSQHLVACTTLPSPTPVASSTPGVLSPPQSTPVAASSSGTCSNLLSSGDRDVGISITSDTSCVRDGGTGCVGNSSCRFCKVLETPQSKHLQLCSALISAIESPQTIQALRATTTNTDTSDTANSQGPILVFVLPSTMVVVGLVAYAVKRSRDQSNEDMLMTPKTLVHRNKPLCTL